MSSTATRPRSNVRDALGPLSRRRRELRRRRIRIVLALVLVAALLIGGGWLVGWSSVLAARTVKVVGVERLSQDEVVQAAQVPLGQPLARVDVDAIARRVAALRPVATVHVGRGWPQTVTIQVTERTAVFALTSGGAGQVVDASGIVFAPSGPHDKDLITAQTGSTDVQLLADVAVVIKALPPALKARTQSIRADTRDTIKVNLTKGDTVEWGSADESSLKGEVALALLKHKGSVYNVTVPAHPTIR